MGKYVSSLFTIVLFGASGSFAGGPFDTFAGAFKILNRSCTVNGVTVSVEWNTQTGFEVIADEELPVLRRHFENGYMSLSLKPGYGDFWGGKVEVSGGPGGATRVADNFVPGANPIEIRTKQEMRKSDSGFVLIERFYDNSWYLVYQGGARETLCTYTLERQ